MVQERYTIAIVVAAVIIAIGGVYAWFDHNIVERELRSNLGPGEEEGRVPPVSGGIDLESLRQGESDSETDAAVLIGEDFEMAPSLLRRQKIAYFLAHRWYLWVPVVLLVCVGSAALFGFSTKPA